jgi:hypothetical protein
MLFELLLGFFLGSHIATHIAESFGQSLVFVELFSFLSLFVGFVDMDDSIGLDETIRSLSETNTGLFSLAKTVDIRPRGSI